MGANQHLAPDVTVLDVELPDVDGFELAEKCKPSKMATTGGSSLPHLPDCQRRPDPAHQLRAMGSERCISAQAIDEALAQPAC
jgi:CheY-like chemotaxis protein